MKKCLKITLSGTFSAPTLIELVQKNAHKLNLEGSASTTGESMLRIVICGTKEATEALLDSLHKDLIKYPLCEIEIEPFVKDKDYRGVFRIIE